jgi:hypothetical protein
VGPPLPLLAPSRAEPSPGLTVILLDAFIEKIILRAVIKALRWGSARKGALTGHHSPSAREAGKIVEALKERALDSGLPAQLQACFAELRQLPLAP